MKLFKKIKQKWMSLRMKILPESNSVFIHQSIDEYSARILKMKLEANDVNSWIVDERDSSYNAFGYVYLYVTSSDEEKAKLLISSENE